MYFAPSEQIRREKGRGWRSSETGENIVLLNLGDDYREREDSVLELMVSRSLAKGKWGLECEC